MKIESKKFFIPAILWAGFILLVSWNVAGLNLPESLFDILAFDKAAHATVYAILSFLGFYGFFKNKLGTRLVVVIVVLFCSMYGILMEILQGI